MTSEGAEAIQEFEIRIWVLVNKPVPLPWYLSLIPLIQKEEKENMQEKNA